MQELTEELEAEAMRRDSRTCVESIDDEKRDIVSKLSVERAELHCSLEESMAITKSSKTHIEECEVEVDTIS